MQAVSPTAGQVFGAIVAHMIARQAVARGTDAERVATQLAEQLRAPDLRFAFVFADWRLDPATIARVTQRGLDPAPVAGGTTTGVIARETGDLAAVGLGLYGDWARIGIGVAAEISKSPLTRSRDAVRIAAGALGTTAEALDPARHIGITILDGKCGHEEAFCIGSAAAVPQIRVIGGCASVDPQSPGRPYVWVRGEAMADAGLVLVLESELPFCAVTSAHLVPTDRKCVVTGAAGRVIDELDGMPAVPRLHELVDGLGERLDDNQPLQYSFARYIDGQPYVRSMTHIIDGRIHVATAVEVGHVLRIMRPLDLIGTTRRDLAATAERVGGTVSALLAFSCIARHWEAAARGLVTELGAAYSAYPTVGFQSFGEQSGMLLVNHTLTGLAIGARR